jgi:hypothetical protein
MQSGEPSLPAARIRYDSCVRRECPNCGYDLTALTTPRCPECGRPFTPTEWADPTLLRRMLAWERTAGQRTIFAFPATVLSFILRPRQSLRLLRDDDGLLRVVGFALLLVPFSWIFAFVLSWVGVVAEPLIRPCLRNADGWKNSLWASNGPYRAEALAITMVRMLIHCTTFIATIAALWIPALIATDWTFRHQRRAFRLFAKALLYSLVWAALLGAFFATLGNAVLEQLGFGWAWNSGMLGHVFPWICWVALAVVAAQAGVALWFIRSPSCAFFETEGRAAVFHATLWISVTLPLAAYLMLVDRYLHLRFFLLFSADFRFWLLSHVLGVF